MGLSTEEWSEGRPATTLDEGKESECGEKERGEGRVEKSEGM